MRIFKSFFVRKLMLMLTDAVLSCVALFITLLLSHNFIISDISALSLCYIPVSFIAMPVIIYVSGTHRITWRHSGFRDVVSFAVTILVGVAFSLPATSLIANDIYLFNLIELVCTMVFSVCMSVVLRMGMRYVAIKSHRIKRQAALMQSGNISDYGRSLIIGAGAACEILIKEMFTDASFLNCVPVAIIDDNMNSIGTVVRGVPVVGNRNDIDEIVKKYQIKTIFFAIPSASKEDRKQILKLCSKTGCDVRTMPGVDEALDSLDAVSKIRKVSISDLLGRDMVKIDTNKICGYIEGRTVLVTGAGGSIGSELCRQIAKHRPSKLVLFDIYENSTYDIQNELIRSFPELNVVALIGSVRDIKRLDSVFEEHRPEIVYHAAAHKHVPLMENSPHEAVKNNVFGTLNTVKIADKYGVKRFVMISTDKAVNPTNIMGTTKRLCEMIIQTYNKNSKTEFVAVRFGNVLGSNGSVIPLFERQIAAGGPVTVTHPNIIRYFMTIPEAVSLVLTAGASAAGGEIFVLDMGDPVKIIDLAENMIRLSGFEPYHNMDIVFTGLRPGEKLYEELLMDEEGLERTDNELIYIGRPIELDEDKFADSLDELWKLACDETSDIRAALHALVPTFKEYTEKKD